MQKPQTFITRMTLFVFAVVLLAILLKDALLGAFMANAALNGVIVGTLLLGIVFAFRRVFDLKPELDWITAFKRSETAANSITPKLMAPAAALLSAQQEGGMRLSTLSMRSVLDGIGSRLEESREISRYFTQLLVFLGLLGTFWGLLGTIGAIGGTINSLTVDGGDMALMFDELKAGLNAPLSGMGTAFSSSLFGLAGSLMLGFMDLQASQAQTRFYNGVEDWLASVTHLSRSEMSEGVASPNSYMTALMEQTADGIDRLQRTLKQSEESRHQGQATMTNIAEALAKLSDGMDAQAAQAAHGEEMGRSLTAAITQLAETSNKAEPVAPPPAIDDATKQHIRNLDIGIKRMIEEQGRTSENLIDELRVELKLLSRTIAAGLDSPASGAGNPSGGSGGSGGSKSDTLAALLALGGSSFLKDRGVFDPKRPDVGYQGKIPKYQYVQEQVTGRDDSDRRPGSAGRRYMSDVIYAKAPENQEPMSVAEAKAKAKAQAQGFAEGGYLNGNSDGQADKVPGSIDGVQEARLSHGEYVLPADLVSLLGNGNSDAGAKALDDFMAMVRKQGTGTEKQQKNIKADKVLASLMKGMV